MTPRSRNRSHPTALPLARLATMLAALSAIGGSCNHERPPLPKGPPPEYETPRGYDAPGIDGAVGSPTDLPTEVPPAPPTPKTALPATTSSASAPAPVPAPSPMPSPAPTPSHATTVGSTEPTQAPAPWSTPGKATPVGTAPIPAPVETKRVP